MSHLAGEAITMFIIFVVIGIIAVRMNDAKNDKNPHLNPRKR